MRHRRTGDTCLYKIETVRRYPTRIQDGHFYSGAATSAGAEKVRRSNSSGGLRQGRHHERSSGVYSYGRRGRNTRPVTHTSQDNSRLWTREWILLSDTNYHLNTTEHFYV